MPAKDCEIDYGLARGSEHTQEDLGRKFGAQEVAVSGRYHGDEKSARVKYIWKAKGTDLGADGYFEVI